MDISRRKRLILEAVVRLHEDSGDPIGSHLLSEFLRELSVSTATLRNEMAELTLLGLLEQPYTSAGRVPTLLGTRYYVDNLMSVYPVSEREKKAIRDEVYSMDNDPDKAAESSTKSAADFFGLAAAASTPFGGTPRIVHFQFMRVGRYNVAALGITDSGSVKTRVCRVEKELSGDELERLEKAAEGLAFVAPEDVSDELLESLAVGSGIEPEKARPVIKAAASIVFGASDVRVYTHGQQNLLRFPELDSERKELLELFSDTARLRRTLFEDDAPVTVKIGDEDGSPGLSRVSFVTAKYHAAAGQTGGLAVAGPVRMNYAYVIPRLRYFCDTLSELLKNPA